MASPAVALPNGVPTPMQLDADADPAQSINSSTKRKRESSNVDEKQQPNGIAANGVSPTNPPAAAAAANNAAGASSSSSANATRIDRSTVRDYFELLQSFDTTPSILKRPLPEPTPSDEPDAKRQKSVDSTPFPSIADKVANDEYRDVEAIITDIKTSITDQLAELRHVEPGKDTKQADLAIASIIEFKQKAYGLFRREMTYPRPTHVPEVLRSLDSTNDLDSNASGNMVLTVFGDAPRPRQLYSSLQQPIADGGKSAYQPLRETGLPNGMKAIKAVPYFFPSALEKEKKSKTLGELFPPPRNLPSLQPPKAPKSTTKGVQVGWHRPELTEKSKYRAGSYFSQTISTGRWLDYSNAAPPSQIMTKQRERALSLAGNKPSSSDIEMSEMEALFRGAFSSFAPSKDDSAAMISSGLISQTLWWQRAGQRSLDRLIEAELPEEPNDDAGEPTDNPAEQVDEELIRKAIDDWDDSLVDPSLEEACCPKKPDEEKDVDDILQDVSDMIQTLISYQKNRNLTLPTASSQSRYAADPAHSDMLTNGTPVQPGEEETATYQALKAQLVLVIQMLPPYCVARLNSDKLEELNISTKLEIRTDEYQGVMEEDEAAARARAAQAAAANPRPTSHRPQGTPNNMQYNQQYHTSTNRPPMPTQPYYGPQTPVRPPQPNLQRPPQTMPAAYPPRPPSNAGYRPPSGYPAAGYAQPYAKPPASYAQPGPYPGTPTQNRQPYQPPHMSGYSNTMVTATPPARHPTYTHPPNTAAPAYHHQPYQPYQPPHPQHGTPTHPAYGHYPNGAGGMPQRTASPQVHHHHQQPQHPHMSQPAYHPSPTPTRQPSYGGQPNMMNDPSRRYYPPAGQPPMQNHQGQPQPPPNQGQAPPNSAFHTSLNPHQVQQAMDQAKARFQAQRNAQQSNEVLRGSVSNQGQGAAPGHGHVGAPVGLGGIGLGQDPNRMAAARANMPSGVNYSASSPSPKPQLNSPAMNAPPPAAVNGSPAMAPTGPAVANGNGGPPSTGNEA
ncbi:hypothetical protein F4809DRAFT_641876 [Biscogniauxia mediterranea]|nr:hypothetical protein F4809DRAFT_641876 [Biscogniauxia mediterranea]